MTHYLVAIGLALRGRFDILGYLGGICILFALMFMIFWYICSLEVEDREIISIGSQSHYDKEKERWYVLFLFETKEPFASEEMKNPCEDIDELVYIDLEIADSENSTQGLKDIREAMKTPGKTYL